MIIGVDPGNTGAIAFLTDEGELINVVDIPVTKVKVGDKWRSEIDADKVVYVLEDKFSYGDVVFLERVQAMPRFNMNTGKYDKSQGGAANIAYGRGGGIIEGVFAAHKVQVYRIPSAEWRPVMVGSKTDKEKSRLTAIKLWPDKADLFKLKTKHGRAEAALIGRYGVKHYKMKDE